MTDTPAASSGPLTRFAWQSGGMVIGRGAALVGLLLIARDLGLERYGEFVVVLAMLELALAPWKPTVQQGAAARIGRGGSHRSWLRVLVLWWLVGSAILGPIVGVFAGWTAAAAVVAASAANAIMIEHVPAHFLAGRQRRIAVATSANQLARLVLIVGLIAFGVLTPTWAIVAHGAGYLIGAILMRAPATAGTGPIGLMRYEVGVELLRWVEAQGPIVVVAILLGLTTAGGFDLIFKLSTAIAFIISGIGLILLPRLVEASEPVGRLIARGVRLPTVISVVLAAGFGLAAVPVLSAFTNTELSLGLAPALLAVVIALAPWLGVSKTALITLDASRWLLPAQIATSSATVVAVAVASNGVVWAALAVAVANAVGAWVLWYGLRSAAATDGLGEIFNPTRLRGDLDAVRRRASARLARASRGATAE